MMKLVNARVIDGTGGRPIEKASIVIDRNRITAVRPGATLSGTEGAVDLSGLTVLPGLIDCHLHLGGFLMEKPGRPAGQVSVLDALPFFLDYLRAYSKRRKLAVQNGVTSVRSAGDNYPHIIGLRDRIGSGKLVGPRIIAPGPIFTAPGGHPASTIYRRNRYIVEHATRMPGDPAEARAEVKSLAQGGVDCVKAVYSEMDPMDLSHRLPRLALGILEAVVDEAHRHGLRAMVHAGSPEETGDAVDAGADSIEHALVPGASSVDFPRRAVRAMADRGVYYVPTLSPAWAYQSSYPDLFSTLKSWVKRMHAEGVPIALGTDAGTPGVVIGKSAHKELALLVEAGLSPMDAILAGTGGAARNIGRPDDLGTLEDGKLADLLVVSGDPLADVTQTQTICMVVKDGRILLNRLSRYRRQ